MTSRAGADTVRYADAIRNAAVLCTDMKKIKELMCVSNKPILVSMKERHMRMHIHKRSLEISQEDKIMNLLLREHSAD